MNNEYLGFMLFDRDGEIHTYDIERQGDKLVAGTCCNTGLLPELEMDYDWDVSEEENLQEFHQMLWYHDFSKNA